MDKELARSLHVLITPDVQEALNRLLEYRKEMAIRNIMGSKDDQFTHQCQGQYKEIEYLLKIRDVIISKAE